MRRLLAFLALTALVIAGAVWLADRPGEVTIHWQGWRVETTVPVLLLALLALLAILAGAGRLAGLILGAPGRFLAHRRDRRARKGLRALSDGLAALAAGDGRRAARLGRTADKLLADPSLTGLLRTQAAQLSGDGEQVKAGYQALLGRPETAFLGDKGLMELALAEGDRTTALAHAAQAFARRPEAEGLAATLFDLQAAAGLWAEAEHTLTAAKRHRSLPAAAIGHRRALALFARAEAARRADELDAALDLALNAHDADPGFVPAVVLAAGLWRRRGKERKAASLLLSAFRADGHPALAAAWAAPGESEAPLDRVKRVQRLVEANPAAAAGHLALAEAALDARLWGQARTHLDTALAAQPSRRGYTLLARLENDERKDEAAAQAWAAKAALLGPDPAWHCATCTHAVAEYALACPECGAIGTMAWR